MEPIATARRTEDIALDLLKFVASQETSAAPPPDPPAFAVASSAKPEDQVTQLLDLCMQQHKAVEAK